MTDHQIAADNLHADISTGETLVTVHADDVRAVLAELERLQAIEQRAILVDTGGVDQPVGVIGRATARYILGEG